MRTNRTRMDLTTTALDASCETLLLGRLGSELALIYHETLQAPVPPRLQALIERLERAMPSRADRTAEAPSRN